jgi:hypothetical protein
MEPTLTRPLSFLFPRGLANAVAAFAVVNEANGMGIASQLTADWQSTLVSSVFGVIVFSNLLIAVYLASRPKAGPGSVPA